MMIQRGLPIPGTMMHGVESRGVQEEIVPGSRGREWRGTMVFCATMTRKFGLMVENSGYLQGGSQN